MLVGFLQLVCSDAHCSATIESNSCISNDTRQCSCDVAVLAVAVQVMQPHALCWKLWRDAFSMVKPWTIRWRSQLQQSYLLLRSQHHIPVC